jgi:hypothetical protein
VLARLRTESVKVSLGEEFPTMHCSVSSWFRVVTLVCVLALAASAAIADDMSTFLAEKTDALQKLRSTGAVSGEQITAILDEVSARVQALSKGADWANGTKWLATQYGTTGNNAKAAETLDSLGTDSGLSAEDLRNAQIQSACYWSQAHEPDKASERWTAFLSDPSLDPGIKNDILTGAIDSSRSVGDWQSICTLGKTALAQALGDKRDIYIAMGKAAIAVGDYQLGEQAFQNYHNEFPTDLPPRLMFDYDKQATLCHNEGKTDTVGYLEDLGRLLDNYKSDDKTRTDMGGYLSNEYAALGQKWVGIAKAYADRGEDSPVPLDEARQKAVALGRAAFEGLEGLTKEQQDNMVHFNTSIMDACFGAAESLATVGQVTAGQALIERLKAKLGDEAESDPDIAERIKVETRKLPMVADAALKPIIKATPISTSGPEVAAATPAATIAPTPVRSPRTTPARTPAAAPDAAAAPVAQGGLGAGTVALIAMLLAAAVGLVFLAMRKPKVR